MDTIREFIEGLDSVDLVGVRRPWSRIGPAAARIMDNISCCLGGGLVLLIVPGLLFSLALTLSTIVAVFEGG